MNGTTETLERIAMKARLAELRTLALRSKSGSDLERQLAASMLVELAAKDWRELLPPEEEEAPVICFECSNPRVDGRCSIMCAEIHKADEAADARGYEP